MLTRLDLQAGLPRRAALRGLLPRAAVDVASVTATVEPIVADVRARGEAAVTDATQRFDGVTLTSIKVDASELARALETLDPQVRSALEVAIARVRQVHAAQRPGEVTTEVAPGGTVTHVPGPTSWLSSPMVNRTLPEST